MRDITTTVYQFDELNDDAKDRAREWYREVGLDYDWWDCIYDDANTVGLKITAFDLYSRRTLDGTLTVSLQDSITAILKNHGACCDTYHLATEYQALLDAFKRRYTEDTDLEDKEQELKRDYTYTLREEYLAILDKEYEYLTSDESVDETIRANEYEFTKEGKRA